MIPIDRMWNRIKITKSESEAMWFFDLMYFGEMVTKLIVLGLVAQLEETRERPKYRIEYSLARTDGIGGWVKTLDDLAKGPVVYQSPDEVAIERRELSQRFAKDNESWQRRAVLLLHEACQFVDLVPAHSDEKVALLTWFQSFANLRNRTRGHGATLGGICAEMAPRLEESLRLICDSYSGFQLPWLFLKRNLSGKYRVIEMTGDTSRFDYLKRENEVNLPDGLYRGVGNHLFQIPLVFSDADLTDFRFANGNFRDRRFETLSYLTDDVVDVENDQYLIPPSQLPRSGTAGGPSLDFIGNTFVNLPPNIPDYVARPELESRIAGLLADDRRTIITLVGRGGVGKTSTALEVLRRTAMEGDYFALLWFSARDIDLMPDGPKVVEPDVLTEKEIASQLVALMNPPGSSDNRFDEVEYFRSCLAGQTADGPNVFVFDNFETVRNPSDVFTVIDTYIRPPNKVLITSRTRSFRGDYPVEVRGMNRPEFDALASATAHKLGIANLVDSKYLDELYEESDGHPYVVKVLLGVVASKGGHRKVERVMAERDDMLDALFERTYSSLDLASQRVFLTLASWRSMVPRLAIEAALLRPENEHMDVGRAIDALDRSSLIEVVGEGGSEHEFLRVPLAASVFGRKKLTVSPMRTAVEADSAILQMFGATKPGEAARGIGPRVDSMVSTLAKRAGRCEDIQDGIRVLEYVGRQFPDAWLGIADLAEELARLDQAADAVRSYLEANPKSSQGWSRLASLSSRTGDYLGEVGALCDVAQLPGGTLEDASRAANRFNSLMHDRKIELWGDDKRVVAQRLRKLLEQNWEQADATTLSRLAWLCIHLDDVDSARRYAEVGLAHEPTNEHCLRLIERMDQGRG